MPSNDIIPIPQDAVFGTGDPYSEQEITPASIEDAFGVKPTASGKDGFEVARGFAGDLGISSQPKITDTDILKSKYGDNFDDSMWFGGDDIGDSWNMGVLGKYNTNEGRTRKFKEWYPEGDIRFTSGAEGNVAIARRNPSEPYRKISNWQTVPFDVLASGPTLVGLAAAPFTAGASFGVGVLGETVATAFGSIGESLLAKNWEPERNESALLRAGGEGAIQAIASSVAKGGVIGAVLGNLTEKAAITPGARKALAASNEEGLVPLTKGQFYSGDPAVKSIYEQYSTQNAKGLEESLKAYESLGEDGLKAYVEKNGMAGLRKSVLSKLVTKQGTKIDSLIGGMTMGGVSWKEGSSELKKTLDNYFSLSRAQEDIYYKEARDLANSSDVEFDMVPVQDLAKEIQKGVRTRSQDFLSTGRTVVTNPISAKLDKILTDLIDVGPVVSKLGGGKTSAGGRVATLESSMDQIIQLRRRIGDALSDAEPGTTEYRDLSRLYGEYTKAIQNPTHGDPGWVDLWKRANEFSSLNHNLRELDPIVALGRADPYRYAQYARNLVKPENADSLLLLEGLVKKTDPASWDTFRSSFIGHIAEDPAKGMRTLDSYKDNYREDALRALMTPDEEKTMREYFSKRTDLENSPLWKAKELADTNLAIKGLELVNSGNLDDLAQTVKLSGGKTSPTSRGMKAAIVNKWFQDAHIPDQHVDTGSLIDRDKFIRTVETWKNGGKLDVLFTPSDWKWLTNIENYAIQLPSTPVTATGSSTGASMQGAAQAGLEQRIGPEVAEAIASGNEAKAAKKVWNTMKLPLGRSFTGYAMGLNKRITQEPKGFNSATRNTIKILQEFAKRAPVLAIEAMDSIHYEDTPPELKSLSGGM